MTLAECALDIKHGGGFGKILRWFLSHPFWWPISALAYCMYLSEVATDVAAYWLWLSPERGGMGYMLTLYVVATLTNAAVAIFLSVLVERPFMRLRSLVSHQSWSWSYGTAPPAARTDVFD